MRRNGNYARQGGRNLPEGDTMTLVLIILFTLLGSICSVGFAALLLLFKGNRMLFVTAGLIRANGKEEEQ